MFVHVHVCQMKEYLIVPISDTRVLKENKIINAKIFISSIKYDKIILVLVFFLPCLPGVSSHDINIFLIIIFKMIEPELLDTRSRKKLLIHLQVAEISVVENREDCWQLIETKLLPISHCTSCLQ